MSKGKKQNVQRKRKRHDGMQSILLQLASLKDNLALEQKRTTKCMLIIFLLTILYAFNQTFKRDNDDCWIF